MAATGVRRRFGVPTLLQNRALLTLMLGHFTVDMYVGLLPVLYPLLQERFTLDFGTVGLVSLAYTGTASLAQPAFGWVADRFGTRLIGLALVWTAAMFATIGFAPTFPILLLLAAAAGLGSAAYHPLGALSAAAAIPAGQRNQGMSVYVTGGTLGVAAGPLLGAAIFGIFGTRGTALMLLPGAGIAFWMLLEVRAARRVGQVGRRDAGRRSLPPIPLGPLAVTVGVMMLRAWTIFGISAFVPTWYDELGYDATFYGLLATTLVLASAAGNLGSGSLADRFGRRTVMIGSLVLTIPAVLLFAQFPGPAAFGTAILVGFLAASTGPLMLTLAQGLMVGRAGVASGVILGLGFVAGAIGVPVMGVLADAFGMQNAMRSQALVALLTIGVAWLLPNEARMRELEARG